jgi:hypothetical protein
MKQHPACTCGLEKRWLHHFEQQQHRHPSSHHTNQSVFLVNDLNHNSHNNSQQDGELILEDVNHQEHSTLSEHGQHVHDSECAMCQLHCWAYGLERWQLKAFTIIRILNYLKPYLH